MCRHAVSRPGVYGSATRTNTIDASLFDRERRITSPPLLLLLVDVFPSIAFQLGRVAALKDPDMVELPIARPVVQDKVAGLREPSSTGRADCCAHR